MKPALKTVAARTSLALLTLLGGLPSTALLAKGVLDQPSGRPAHFGNDGVGGIEKAGPTGGPAGKAGTGGAVGGASITAEPDPWIDLGGAFGSYENSSPVLSGTGTGEAGTLVTLTLAGAKPGAAAALVVGITTANVPFKGGMLVPSPMLILPGLPVNAQGTLSLPAALPASLPSGFTIYTQMWIPDSSAVHGFASSNGLELLVP